ncbi:hypothetical protein HZH68_002361 [Vespula germanica]|uniref:Uncharacterized protein n=1 Tax=Vespula germanica TaxID=30212 RepID=A0A834KVX0_VESGE|nr:hypothetical protein HZH68_002361 [Vespula germanica]
MERNKTSTNFEIIILARRKILLLQLERTFRCFLTEAEEKKRSDGGLGVEHSKEANKRERKGCSIYKRLVASGTIAATNVPSAYEKAAGNRVPAGGEEEEEEGEGEEEEEEEEEGVEEEEKEEEEEEKKEEEAEAGQGGKKSARMGRPSHPSSYRSLVLASPNDSVRWLPRCTGQTRQSGGSGGNGNGSRNNNNNNSNNNNNNGDARQRSDDAGEANYQSTPPPPPCTKTLPRRQRRLPLRLPSRVSSEPRMGALSAISRDSEANSRRDAGGGSKVDGEGAVNGDGGGRGGKCVYTPAKKHRGSYTA